MSEVLTRLGAALADRYRIERELGAGGMATVYLAQDLKHDRQVAIKVLRPELSAVIGAERFLREIKTIANLQHPHILGLIDSGEVNGTAYYVMPFVDGESLRDRLRREKQLPIADALRLATEVAGALDYAHRHGIIHRDIKPENILLHDGRALVADFGIALAVSSAGGNPDDRDRDEPGHAALHESPEQAMGEREITARSDVYALGCVTYEMLVGEPPFTGPTAQAIVAKVMTTEPARITSQRKSVPAAVDEAVAIALQKLPADRFATAAEFAAALTGATGGTRARRSAAGAPRPGAAALVPWLLAAVAGAVAAYFAVASRAKAPAAALPVYETTIAIPDSTPLAYIGGTPLGVGTRAFAVSPDGSTLVFVGQSGGTTRLYVRPLGSSAVTALSGTEGAYTPFFSPDGGSIGFFSGSRLKRTALQGGATVTVADLVLPYGGLWLADGRILVASGEGHMLVTVPSSGGAPTRLAEPKTVRLSFPEPLPGDNAVLMSSPTGHIAVVSIATGKVRFVGMRGPVDPDSITGESALLAGTHAKYLASGHLLYHSQDGAVMAVPFDPATYRVLGAPAPVLARARLESIWGAGQLVVTRDGTLIYARGENGRQTSLVWRGDKGTVDTVKGFGRADYGDLDLSADGTRLFIRICPTQGGCGYQTLNLGEGVQSSIATEPDGWWDRGERVFQWKPAQRATLVYSPENRAIADSIPGIIVLDVARDGLALYATADTTLYVGSGAALLAAHPARTGGFRIPEADAWGHQLRPGGEWIAYTAGLQDVGDWRVYLAHTRPPFEHWRVSPGSGEEPVWNPAGELVYREGNRWMRVSLPTAAGGRPGMATFLFSGPYLNVLGRSHDVAPDGRHLLVSGPEQTTTNQLVMVTNWLSRLPASSTPK